MSHVALPEPDAAIVARRDTIVEDLRRLIGPRRSDRRRGRPPRLRDRRADGLPAHAAGGRAAALHRGGLARCCAYCHQNDIKVVARGAGTSLSGGALPAEDALVIGVSRMSRMLEIDYVNRIARVEVGITNLGISEAVKAHGFFYAPDPSSQLACTLAGNIGMNSGGAHCLKYGVTTNNVLGLKMVLMDGEIVEIGGAHLDSPGYDLLGLMIGSEGQFGIVTEATVRILRSAEGARPMLLGFDSSEAAGQCVSAIIGAGIIPVAIEFMDKPRHPRLRGVRQGRLSHGGGSAADHRGGRLQRGDRRPAGRHHRDRQAASHPSAIRISQSAEQSAAIWKGRKSAFGAIGRISDYYCMDGTIPLGKLGEVLVAIAHICDKHGLQGGQHLPRRRRQPASADPLRRQRPDAGGARRAGGRRDPRAVRGGRRLPHRRARRRHREARPHARAVHRDRPRPCRCASRPCSTPSGC